MTPCTRGCCWSPYCCTKARTCQCHAPTLTEWLGVKAADEPDSTPSHRDPTAQKAIRNVMRERRKPR